MRAFLRRGDDAVALLDANERAVIAALVADVRTLTGTDLLSQGRSEPEDDAVLRLFPNAVPTDQEVADEFRRLTEADLRTLKYDRLDTLLEDLKREEAEWVVASRDALSVAAALTDVRLVIAARLGLKTDEDADLLRSELEVAQGLVESGLPEGMDVDHKRVWLSTIYQALTWLQDSLIACLMDQEGGDDE